MKIKEGIKDSTDDLWHDLAEGYLKPEDICEDAADAKRVTDAVAIIKDFADSCEEQLDEFYR